MIKCPFCKQKLGTEFQVPKLNRRRSRIYNAVVKAGPAGVPKTILIEKMYGGDRPTPKGDIVLRVNIHEINRTLKPLGQRIKSNRQHGYCLMESA